MTDFLQRKNTKGWSTLTKSQRRWLIVSQMQVPLALASRREGSIGVRDTSSGGLPIIRTSRSSWLLTYRNGIHTRPNAVSHPSTNWAWHSVTTRLWRRTRRLGEQLVPMTALTPTTTSHDGDEPAAVAADCCEVGLCLVASVTPDTPWCTTDINASARHVPYEFTRRTSTALCVRAPPPQSR